MTMTTEAEAPDPVDATETLGEMFALAVRERGLDFLKRILAAGTGSREPLLNAGDELRRAGLKSAAKLVYEAAKTAPSWFDKPTPRGLSDEWWQQTQERRRKTWEAGRRRRGKPKQGQGC